MDVKTLLMLDESAQDITLKKPTIPHPEAGLSFFASLTNRKERMSATTMALWSIPPDQVAVQDETYGEKLMQGLRKRFESGGMS